jgi:hypothetical protein
MNPTNSEWMKVMLDEIARKKAEAEQDQIEYERRLAEQQAGGLEEAVREGRPA